MSTTSPSRLAWRHPAEGGSTTLYLVRHGRTKGNVDGILCGRTDVPLDDHGLRQARLVAGRIAAEIRADLVISSPLIRARRTAEIIAEGLSVEVSIEPDLAEWHFGEFEGRSASRMQEEAPDLVARFQDLEDDDAGWPGGESRREFHLRVRTAFERILTQCAGQHVIVVAHGGVLGSFAAQVHGEPPNDWRRFLFDNCSLSHFEVLRTGTNVMLLNDCQHLSPLCNDSESE